jgi:hypothetical protein
MPQISRRPARKKAVRLAVAVTGIAGLAGGTLAPAPAYAGTNGQQVKVCDSLNFMKFALRGTNQNGRPAYTGYRSSSFYSNCVEFTGYWWKGPLTVYWGSPNVGLNFVYKSIKSDLPSTNWYTCYTSAHTCIKGLY